MVRVRKPQYVVTDPIVDFDRVDQLLSVGFKADVEGRPACCELYFPGKFALAFRNVRVAFITATFNPFLPYFISATFVMHSFRLRIIALRMSHVEPMAVCTLRKIGQSFQILFLPG